MYDFRGITPKIVYKASCWNNIGEPSAAVLADPTLSQALTHDVVHVRVAAA